MTYETIRNKNSVGAVQTNTQVNTQVDTQVNTQVGKKDDEKDTVRDRIIAYCNVPRSKKEITEHLGYKDARSTARNYIKPMVDEGILVMTIPEKPNSSKQKYVIAR